MSEPWWSDNYDGPCQWADRDPSNKPWCELHQSCGSIDAHACWFAALTDRAEKAEAQIQRVRVLIDTADSFTPPLTLTTAELRRALGVPCPTCSGPIRETVGLVCQTCGTDYGGASDE